MGRPDSARQKRVDECRDAGIGRKSLFLQPHLLAVTRHFQIAATDGLVALERADGAFPARIVPVLPLASFSWSSISGFDVFDPIADRDLPFDRIPERRCRGERQ